MFGVRVSYVPYTAVTSKHSRHGAQKSVKYSYTLVPFFGVWYVFILYTSPLLPLHFFRSSYEQGSALVCDELHLGSTQ